MCTLIKVQTKQLYIQTAKIKSDLINYDQTFITKNQTSHLAYDLKFGIHMLVAEKLTMYVIFHFNLTKIPFLNTTKTCSQC